MHGLFATAADMDDMPNRMIQIKHAPPVALVRQETRNWSHYFVSRETVAHSPAIPAQYLRKAVIGEDNCPHETVAHSPAIPAQYLRNAGVGVELKSGRKILYKYYKSF